MNNEIIPIPPIPIDPSADLALIRDECDTLIRSITISALTIRVTDQASYTEADSALAKIREAKRLIEPKLEAKIVPVRAYLDKWYELRRSLTGDSSDLDTAERTLKSSMGAYQLAERKRAQELQRLRDEETARLSREAEAALAKSSDPESDPIARARAKLQAKKAVTQAEEVKVATTVTPTRAPSSTFVPREDWEITDLKAFLKGVVDGIVPIEMVEVHRVKMNAMWKVSKEKVKGWPGVGKVDGGGVRGR